MTKQYIVWRKNVAHDFPIYEAFVDGVMVGWITKRPPYCDRGHWQAGIEQMAVPDLDGADAFPRYFMRFDTAKQEMEDFIRWRLWKVPAPNHDAPQDFCADTVQPTMSDRMKRRIEEHGPYAASQTLLGGPTDRNRRMICDLRRLKTVQTFNYEMREWTPQDQVTLDARLKELNDAYFRAREATGA